MNRKPLYHNTKRPVGYCYTKADGVQANGL